MVGTFEILDLDEIGLGSEQTFGLDVLEGLSSFPKAIPSKYLYDDRGSKLYQQITELESYYQTRCELDIINQFKSQIKLRASSSFRIIELGVGDARKSKILIKHCLDQGLSFEYVPIDCSPSVITYVVNDLKKEFANSSLHVLGVVADYLGALAWIRSESVKKNMVLFLGSSIGNLSQLAVRHFLHHLWNDLRDGDHVFIGFDLKKDIKILNDAYNDPKGLTTEFNLNLLDRMNRELGANFDRRKFQHHSFYNPAENRMESWLISKEQQKITLLELQKEFSFEAWEGILVENSYKYNLNDIEELAKTTGFMVEEELMDSKKYFAGAVWKVKKELIAGP